jgi:hypothetical protein
MLVSMAISLLMIASVAQLFATISTSVSSSRASIEMTERLASARNQIQKDLAGVTAPMLPPLRPELGEGYFEYIERPTTDFAPYLSSLHDLGITTFNTSTTLSPSQTAYANSNAIAGDADDILMFTIRSKDGQPFIGKFWNASTSSFSTIESQLAEVVWFTVPNGQSIPIVDQPDGALQQLPLCTLYRRVLLIAPEYQPQINAQIAANAGLAVPSTFFNNFDISARPVSTQASPATFSMVLNSLSDLTRRESRFAHDPRSATNQTTSGGTYNGFPFAVFLPWVYADYQSTSLPQTPSNGAPALGALQGLQPLSASSGRVGEDVVMTNVLAFDVRAFDPTVPILPATDASNNVTGSLTPSDIGYWQQYSNYSYNVAHSITPNVYAPIGYGGFVDLGYTTNLFAYNTTTANPISLIGAANLSGSITTLNTLSTFSGYSTLMPATSNYLCQWLSTGGYSTTVAYPTYDTWSLHYDTITPTSWATYPFSSTNLPSNYGSYLGSNGFDDDGDGIVDNPVTPPSPGVAASAYAIGSDGNQHYEFQYPAPYPVPLRGLQVKIRTYEPDSRQVREVTVTQDFLPQ